MRPHPGPRPTRNEILSATSEELWTFVEHPDPSVRAEAAFNLEVTAAQLDVLLDPTRQPVLVRAVTALLPWCGVVKQASRDPHPLVRLVAATVGWDLSAATRVRLDSDPEVIRGRQILQPDWLDWLDSDYFDLGRVLNIGPAPPGDVGIDDADDLDSSWLAMVTAASADARWREGRGGRFSVAGVGAV